ncbi:MAG TPA: hypothetical protein VKM72_29305 [Thermoanaerobaculia bacterium]|nr:hypothetical protein [Thermoanaerobaculia bacterium]
MRRALLPVLLTAATLLLIFLIGRHVPSANGPAEWQWPYRAPGLQGLGLVLAAALTIPLIYWAAHERRTDWWWALPLLVLLGWALPLNLVRAQPGGFRQVLDALASRHTFGYVFDAGLAPDTRTLLADWPAASVGLNQHSRTHPPGPLLAVRALDLMGRRLPADPQGERGLISAAAESLEREAARVALRSHKTPRNLPSPGTLVLLALLLPLLSALAAWPVHRLAAGLGMETGAALLAAALWLTVPARSVFTPSLDQALPLLVVAAAWMAVTGRRWRALLAGGLLALSVFFSYGYLAAVPLVGLLALTAQRSPEDLRRLDWLDWLDWKRTILCAAGFLLPWIVLALATGFDPWASFRTAVEQHHKIAVASRSYGTWLAWNPYDFLLLLGPAVLALTAVSLFGRRKDERSPAHNALAWGWWALLLVLLVSGSVRGEVGRIWLFLMPFACVLAAGDAVRRWGPRSLWTGLLLVLELALTLALAGNLVFVG